MCLLKNLYISFSLSFMSEDKHTLRREGMKNFMKIRRNQIKDTSEGQTQVAQLNQLLLNNNSDEFFKVLTSQKPEFAYNYLISQNNLLKTPISLAFEQQKWYDLLKSINAWSATNFELVMKNFYQTEKLLEQQKEEKKVQPESELHTFLKNRFAQIIKCICNYNHLDQDKLVQILSQKNCILSQFMKMFLNRANLKVLVPANKQLRLFDKVFTKVSQNLQLQSHHQMLLQLGMKKKQKTWDNRQFIQMLSQPSLLNLDQVKYSFMHELALSEDQKYIYDIIGKMESGEQTAEHQAINQIKDNFFCQFDGVGQTPVDIILRRWQYSKVKQFIQKTKDIQCIRFSVNSLNKVISNRKLSQSQIQEFIEIILGGSIASKGYSQRITKQIKVKNKILEVQDTKYVIVLDKRRVLMAKDKGTSYPLLNYLTRFTQKSSLKVINQLLFQSLDRQVVKSKVISLLKQQGKETKQLQVGAGNVALKQIEQIIYYHQSLLCYICKINNNEILQYFINKLFINFFSIIIWGDNSNSTRIVHMLNRHFFTFYTQLHQNLAENALNKMIIQKVFGAKDSQKFVKDFNLYVELARQFYQYASSFQKHEQWFVNQIKHRLKQYIKNIEKQKLIQLKTFINQGKTQKQVSLLKIMPSLFSAQELQKMNLHKQPQVPQQQVKQGKKGKEKNKKKQQQNKKLKKDSTKVEENYSLKKDYGSFRIQLSKLKQKEINVKQAEIQQKQQNQIYSPPIVYGQWELDFDQCDLEKKIMDLNEQGFIFRFKFHRLSVRGSENMYKKYIDQLKPPLHTICMSMITEARKIQKPIPQNLGKSLQFHRACLLCSDDQIDKVLDLVKSNSSKFKDIVSDWQFYLFHKILPNPFILLAITQSNQLRNIYKLNDTQNIKIILEIVKQCVRSIISDVKLNKQNAKNHIKKMIALKKIKQKLQVQIKKSQSQERQEQMMKAVQQKTNRQNEKVKHAENQQEEPIIEMNYYFHDRKKQQVVIPNLFSDYMRLHSQKLNLRQFYQSISIQQLYRQYGTQAFVNAFSLAAKPLQFLEQVNKIKEQDKLNIAKQLKKINADWLIQTLLKTYQKAYNQKFAFLTQDGFYYHHSAQKMVSKFCLVLQNLSQNDFQKYLEIENSKSFQFYKKLILHIKDQDRCLRVFDQLIIQNNKSVEENENKENDSQAVSDESKSLNFNGKVNKIIKIRKDRLNAALCAFINVEQQVKICPCNPPNGKIALDCGSFINNLSKQNYGIYVSYICKMLKIKANFSDEQKYKIVFDIFSKLFGFEAWDKCVHLLQAISNNKQLSLSPKISFLKGCCDVCSKNMERVNSYNQKQGYNKFVDGLFRALANNEESIQKDESLFRSVWDLNSEKAMDILKPDMLSLQTISRCLRSHPEKVKLFKNIKLDKTTLPQTYRPKFQGQYIPFSKYDADEINQKPYLIDLIVFQQTIHDQWVSIKGSAINNYKHALEQKKKSVFMNTQVMKRHQQIFSSNQLQKFSYQIFNSNSLNSLKAVPKEYIQAYFTTHEQIKGLCNLNASILKQLIDQNHVKKQQLFDIIKTCNMDVIDYFLKRNKSPFDYKLITLIEQYEQKKSAKRNASFIQSLIRFQDRKFVQQFIKHYKILDLYPPQKYGQMTKQLLWQIPFIQGTLILKLFLMHLKQKFKQGEISFRIPAQQKQAVDQKNIQTQQEEEMRRFGQNKITQKLKLYENFESAKQSSTAGLKDGIVFLPLRVAALNGFYQYYFLLLQQSEHNVGLSVLFQNSNRFFFQCFPQQYSFIPLMKKKLQLFKLSQNYFKHKTKQQFVHKLLRACFFGEIYKKQKCCEFLALIFKNNLELSQKLFHKQMRTRHNSYISILCLKCLPDVAIRDEDLVKRYPQQAKFVVNLLKNYPVAVTGFQFIHQILNYDQHLRQLLYIANPKYLKSCPTILEDAHLFSNPFARHIRFFELSQHEQFFDQFMNRCFFKLIDSMQQHQTQMPVYSISLSFKLIRDLLVCCFVSKYEGSNKVLPFICNQISTNQDQFIFDCILSICNRAKISLKNLLKQKILLEDLDHNPAFWNSFKQLLKKTQQTGKFQNEGNFKIFIAAKYNELINLSSFKQILQECCEGLLDVYGCQTYLCNLMYVASQQNMLQTFIKDQLKLQKCKVELLHSKEISLQFGQGSIKIGTPVQIIKQNATTTRFLRIDSELLMQTLLGSTYIRNLDGQHETLKQIECLSKLEFRFDVQSFKKTKSVNLLRRMISKNIGEGRGIAKIVEMINGLKNQIELHQNNKVYSLSDVHGPILINDQTDKNKVVECINFYQFSRLPQSTITIKYQDMTTVQSSYSKVFSDIKEYIRYFTNQINDDQSDNKHPYKFNSTILLAPTKNDPETEEVLLDEFYLHNIITFFDKIDRFGNEISATFNNQIVVKYSIPSIVNLLEVNSNKFECSKDLFHFVSSTLGHRRNIRFVQTILIMIMEDANNIMKVVKGILILYDYQPNPKIKKDRQPYRVDEKISFFDLDYKIDEQIFKITVTVGPTDKKWQQIDSLDSGLISRKDFLNTVFSSTQFLTGYFINKSVLANELVKISKDISQIINSEVNLSINYKQLYRFIDKIKDNTTIKDIDGLLTNLNAYIMFNLRKFITNYLDSKQIALQHQLSLINCFQELYAKNNNIRRDRDSYKVNTRNSNAVGVNYTWNFSNQLKQSDKKGENIKNVYLIQIYRSYFASIVSEGMSFILGFKSHQPSMLVKLQKKQDFDKINVTELSFILLLSNRLPTSDQINYEKVIKIFVSDLTQNVYELDKNVIQKLLELPSQSQDRNLAHMVPVLPENIILIFNHPQSQKSNLRDDKSSKFIQLNLTQQGKFKLENKNKFSVQCIDLIRIDTSFNISIANLTKSINSFISSNFVISMKAPSKFQPRKAIQIFQFGFIDFQKSINNLFAQSLRNKQLQLFASASKNEQIRQNLISKHKYKLFQQNFDQICFQICESGESRILIQKKQIKIFLVPKSSNILNSIIISDTLCKHLITAIVSKNQQIRTHYRFDNNSDCLIAKLQHLLMAPHQIQIIEKCLFISQKLKLNKKVIKKYEIQMKNQQKSKIRYDKQQITFVVRLNNPQHQFFSDRKILQYLANDCEQIIEGISSTKYSPEKPVKEQKQQKGEARLGHIHLIDYDLDKIVNIILVSKDNKPMKEKTIVQINKSELQQIELSNYQNYYLLYIYNDKLCVDGNYIWQAEPNHNYANEKKVIGLIQHQYSLILYLPKTHYQTVINMNECNINVVNYSSKNKEEKQVNEVLAITKRNPQFDVKVRLLSRQAMLLQFTPLVSGHLIINFQKYKLFHNRELQKISLISNSCKQMVQQKTKFVQLIFRKNSIKPVSRQFDKKQINAVFNEPAEKIQQSKIKQQKKTQMNVESMVYIINQKAVRFLTRAGEQRIDVVNACDEEGNITKFKSDSKIWFRHLNIPSQILIPTIKQVDERIELYWTPKIRGPYQVFINNTRLNPSYQIGVCSATAQVSASKIQLPKKVQICFGEQTQLSVELKDSFGNIYTQFEETKKDDHIIIQLISDNIPKTSIKMKAQKIDKYGLKKIRFSVDDPTCNQQKTTTMALSFNMVQLAEFKLKIKGQSLNQRRKNLQKQIESSTKRYYVDINVNRKNFMECLFKYAEQGLDKNFSVKFAGEQGIDAGGLKRQFYDMIGKQMKDPQNPFFVQTDMSRHNEYFINSELMKNKKKQDYFELFGKYLANSIINNYMIGVNFSTTFVKLLYEDPITFDDMLAVLPKQQAKMYESLLNADADYIEDLQIYFSYVYNRKKGIEIEMVENGKDIKVTKQNVRQYIQLLPEFLIVKRYQDIVKSFREGFNKVVKLDVVRRWIRSDQFWCVTAGVKQITPEIVLNNIVIQGGKETHHAWIRAYITEASKQILQGFLKFSTGSSSIDFYQSSKIVVKFQNQGENPKKLPISHTCWKEIDIPAYKTYAIMKQLLNAAFLYCSQGFGFG